MVTIPYTGLRPMQSQIPRLPVMQAPGGINTQARQAAASALANAPEPEPSPWSQIIGNIAQGMAQGLKRPVAPAIPAANYTVDTSPSFTSPQLPAAAMPPGPHPVQAAQYHQPSVMNFSTPALPPVTLGDSFMRRLGF